MDNTIQIIKRHVPSLQKKGKMFVGLCPFHKERTPSFTVSLNTNTFYCFGCHAQGAITNLLSKIENTNNAPLGVNNK
jgi:DNA primase